MTRESHVVASGRRMTLLLSTGLGRAGIGHAKQGLGEAPIAQ